MAPLCFCIGVFFCEGHVAPQAALLSGLLFVCIGKVATELRRNRRRKGVNAHTSVTIKKMGGEDLCCGSRVRQAKSKEWKKTEKREQKKKGRSQDGERGGMHKRGIPTKKRGERSEKGHIKRKKLAVFNFERQNSTHKYIQNTLSIFYFDIVRKKSK